LALHFSLQGDLEGDPKVCRLRYRLFGPSGFDSCAIRLYNNRLTITRQTTGRRIKKAWHCNLISSREAAPPMLARHCEYRHISQLALHKLLLLNHINNDGKTFIKALAAT
jgi:hypothetical protein